MFMFWMIAAALAADGFETQASVHTLPNGLTVILEESHRTDTVALHLAFGVGSRDEREGEKGCAHLFEHLMFEGSANVPTDQFDAWLTQAGGANNAWTSEDTTAYHMTFPSGALDLALFLESDRLGFLDAGLVEENVSNQQLVVLQERNEGYANPNGRDWDAMSRLTWPADHPYNTPVIGTVADIEGFAIDKVRAFWERHYRTQNAVLSLVGNFEEAQALERVAFWFSDVPDKGPPEARVEGHPPQGPTENRDGYILDEVEEGTVYQLYPSVPMGHEDEPALEVLSYLLSYGRGTRLDDRLFYDAKFASDEGAFFYGMDIGGQFIVYARDHKTSLKKLDRLMSKVISEVISRPPTDDELNRAKRSIRGERLDSLEYVENRAEALVDCYRTTGEANCLSADAARYEAVTADDVVRVVSTYLRPEDKQLLSVVPKETGGEITGSVRVELP
jgi:zinc protease